MDGYDLESRLFGYYEILDAKVCNWVRKLSSRTFSKAYTTIEQLVPIHTNVALR